MFLDELKDAQKSNPHYTFVGTMTQMEKSNRAWDEETGFINEAMLVKYIGDLTLPIYYIAGPREMVYAMLEMLMKVGVNDDNIRTEEFSGYWVGVRDAWNRRKIAAIPKVSKGYLAPVRRAHTRAAVFGVICLIGEVS